MKAVLTRYAWVFVLLPLLTAGAFGSPAWGQAPTPQQVQDLLEKYTPPPNPVLAPFVPGPPRSMFSLQKSDTVVVRMMPTSHSGDLNGTAGPYSWPGRPLIVWGRADGGTAPYTFKMEYGDGSPADSGAVDYSPGRWPNYIAVAHTYVGGGPKVARLTVTDANGHVGAREVQIYVQPFTDPSVEMLVRRNAAIQDGLRWLYLQQGGDGAFPGGGSWPTVAATAAAVSAFEVRGYLASDNPIQDVYAEFIRQGLEYIFTDLSQMSISAQTYGDPDTNGDGFGIRCNSNWSSYQHGLVMYALGLSRDPNAVAVSGGTGIAGSTYRQILTNMVDQLAYSQGDGAGGGGWRYDVTYFNEDSDNSAVQWASIGLDAAARPQNLFQIEAPAFVKTQLAGWLDYSRCSDGGYGYTSPNNWCNLAKTASGVFSEYYTGRTAADPVIQNSIAWLDTHWCDSYNNGYGADGFFGSFYAMYAIKKALDDLGVTQVGSHVWYTDYIHFLVNAPDYHPPCGYDSWHQNIDLSNPDLMNSGSWNTDSWIINCYVASTSFAVLTLTPGISCDLYPVAEANPQGACPNTPIHFDGGTSYTTCADRQIVQWLWDFDSSNGADIHQPDAVGMSAYKQDGYPLPPGQDADTVRATLWVIDQPIQQGGEPDTAMTTVSVIINVLNHPPVACLNGPFTARVGEPITLNACCSFDPDAGGANGCETDSITAYLWDFGGDGTIDYTSTKCIPDTVLVFNQETTMSIVLWVEDTHGLRSTRADANLIWSSQRDLSVTADDISFTPSHPLCRDSVEVCANIHCLITGGGDPIPETKVRIYRGEITPLSLLDEQTLTNVTDGSISHVCFRWDVPADSSHERIIVFADADQQVQEISETNNVAEKTMNLGLAVPLLAAPEDSAEDVPHAAQLVWQRVNCAATYRLQVAKDRQFAQLTVDQSGIADTTFAAALAKGTTYFWRVMSQWSPSESEWSSAFWFTTAPLPLPVLAYPANADSGLERTLELAWHPSAEASTYDVQVARDSLFADIVVTQTGVADTTEEVGPLAGGIRHYWRVRSSDGSGYSFWTAPWRFTCRMPYAPALVSPVNHAVDQVKSPNMVWQATQAAVNYRLQVARDSVFTEIAADVAGLHTTSHVVGPLWAGTRYFWRVQATEADSARAWSEMWRFNTFALPAPLLASPTDGATGQPRNPTLTWHPSTDATSYQVQGATDAGFTSLVFDHSGVTDTLKAVGPLGENVQYYWRVRSTDGHTQSAWSTEWSFSTRSARPPLLALPVNGAENQPKTLPLSWHPTSYALYYRLQVAEDSSFTSPVVNLPGLVDSAKTVGPLLAGTRHWWRVEATEPDSAKAWSEHWSFTTLPIFAPVLASPADSALDQPVSLTLRWHPEPGVTSYTLQVARDEAFTTGLDTLHVAAPDTAGAVGPLLQNAWHFWRVRASDGVTVSSWSEVWAFHTRIVAVATVWPGDANNDGVVNALDILPIGLHFARTGPTRENASLDWTPQILLTAWNPAAACYADCDGNGTVAFQDVLGIVQNWNARQSAPPPALADRLPVCLELLRTIDQNPQAPGMPALRASIVDYMRDVLGYRLEFRLESNRPNPFRGSTAWTLTVPVATAAHFSVYDLSGKLVWNTTLPNLAAGATQINWNGANIQGNQVSTGVYYYKLTAGTYHATGKAILVR